MKDAQKPDHISLSTLIGRLNEGRFVIPDFQREFEWEPWDIATSCGRSSSTTTSAACCFGRARRRTSTLSRASRSTATTPTAAPSTSSLTANSGSRRCTTRSSAPDVPAPNRSEPIPLLHPGRPVHGRGLRRRFPVRLDPERLEPSGETRTPVRDPHVPSRRLSAGVAGRCRTGCRDTRPTGAPKGPLTRSRATRKPPRLQPASAAMPRPSVST